MKSYIVSTILCGSLLLLSTGCDRAGGEEGESKSPDAAAEKTGLHGMHDGWWCGHHGIPEDECSMCNRKIAKEFRDKDEWCEKHNRAAPQCFKCDPKLAEPFTKRYVARYGKQPPPWKD
jgi:hypothetical protein